MPQVPPFKDSSRERNDRKHGDCWRYLGDYTGVCGAYLGIVWGVTLRVDGGYMGSLYWNQHTEGFCGDNPESVSRGFSDM